MNKPRLVSLLDWFCREPATTNNKTEVWDDYAIHTNFALGGSSVFLVITGLVLIWSK